MPVWFPSSLRPPVAGLLAAIGAALLLPMPVASQRPLDQQQVIPAPAAKPPGSQRTTKTGSLQPQPASSTSTPFPPIGTAIQLPGPGSDEPVMLPPGKPLRTRINSKDGAEMVWIPPGAFLMGSDPAEIDALWKHTGWPGLAFWKQIAKDESPRHRVVLTRGFWLYRNEVTNEQYNRFLAAYPRHPKPEYADDARFNRPQQPVVGVSWKDAVKYCKWAGARLPTEAEWEYAARGGNTGLEGKPRYAFVWVDALPKGRANVGNLADETAKRAFENSALSFFTGYEDGHLYPVPVGSFAANGFGAFDLAGNVWEWCADAWAEDYYGRSPSTDPRGPSKNTTQLCVLRGGSWYSNPDVARVAYRFRSEADDRNDTLGFRPVGAAPQDE
jgi:formylglycine-generating enzyme required for sulfatase activity